MQMQAWSEIEVETSATRTRDSRVATRFLKGPIPMPEIIAASNLPGKALAIYLAIRHQMDLSREQEVSVPKSLLEAMEVDRDSKSRGLKVLEQAGLIQVVRKKGCSARVRLNDDFASCATIHSPSLRSGELSDRSVSFR